MKAADLLRMQLGQLELKIPEAALDPLIWLLEELFRWNRRINLTAISDLGEGIEKHLIDSLTLLPLLRSGEKLLDVGSGAGFPVLPLKLARPDLEAVSVDAVGKKIAFQKHVVRTLKLNGLNPVKGRIEDLNRREEWLGRFDAIVARAFAPLPVFAARALPCLKPGGRLIAMKGPEGEREWAEHREQMTALGLTLDTLVEWKLPASGAERRLLVVELCPRGVLKDQ